MTSQDSVPAGTTRASFASLKAEPSAQVLIIGAGINGIATFRDLALQGVDVAIIDQGDYASGASSASSHMIHGGIRYLENGEFRLVKESVQERNRLLRLAPHVVKPLQTTIPIYSTFSGLLSAPLRFLTHRQRGKPTERGAFLIKVGLTIYDAFSRDGGSVPRHRFLGRKTSLMELPDLNPALKYTATYFDASVHDPERLVIDLLQDALHAGGRARSANYAAAVGRTDDGVIIEDRVTGERVEFAADVVVNATGAWADLTNDAIATGTTYMGGTKGSHIVVDNAELHAACAGREIFFENKDGRIVLIYPIKGRVLIGTTDLKADVRQTPVITPDEVDYFFDLVSQVFPGIVIPRDSVVYTFSGIRPLPRQDDTQPGFISRDYRIEKASVDGKTPLLTLVGGKLTTFRAMSEHLTDDVLGLLGRKRTTTTDRLPIGGGADYPQSERARSQWVESNRGPLSTERAGILLDRYGTRAAEVIGYIADSDDRPLQTAADYSTAELRFLCSVEQVVHVADLLLRRTSLAFVGRATEGLIDECSRVMAPVLGWTEAQRLAEIERTLQLLSSEHPVPRNLLGAAGR